VVGDSMMPGFADDSLIIVKKTNKFQVGDVVGFKFNDNILIKRIAKIKQKQYYVLGDNQNNSLDSRKLGWLGIEKLIFKVIFRF
jgi:phage repressor protein C with HTH and peptisase S24 domain